MSAKEILSEMKKKSVSDDKRMLEKIQKIIDSNIMTDGIKVANIYNVIHERWKYYMKPWYIV